MMVSCDWSSDVCSSDLETDGTARLQGYGVDANGNIVNGVLTFLWIEVNESAGC